jgi:putative permease
MQNNPVLLWIKSFLASPSRIILAFVLICALLFIFLFGNLLAPVLAALIFAYLLDGIVSRIQRLRVPRTPAVWLVFTLFLTITIALLLLLIPFLIEEATNLIRQTPQMIVKLRAWTESLPERRPAFLTVEQFAEVLKAMKANTDVIGSLQQRISRYSENLLVNSLAITQGAVTYLIYTILIPLMTFFFLKDKQQILDWFAQFSPNNMGLTRKVWREVDQQFSNYIRGRFYEIIIVWICSYIAFKVIHLQYAMLLSVFTGLSVLLPYVGATLMGIPVALIALFQADYTNMDVVIAIGTYCVLQFLDGNVLAPLLLSGVTNLHPIAIIVSFIVFGAIWGFWGVFFAIPLGALVNAVIKAWMSKHAEVDDAETAAI